MWRVRGGHLRALGGMVYSIRHSMYDEGTPEGMSPHSDTPPIRGRGWDLVYSSSIQLYVGSLRRCSRTITLYSRATPTHPHPRDKKDA